MDESNRVQRTRPRPYDLRRKVLLKNFLREQMTHIPLPPPRMPMEEDDDSSTHQEDSSSAIGNEENIAQPNNKQGQLSPTPAPEPTPSTSTSTETPVDTPTSQQSESEVDKNTQPTFTKLSNLLRLKISSVRSRQKGMSKAKQLKMKAKGVAPQGILRVSNKTDSKDGAKGKAKSFFTKFKSRRNKKRQELEAPTTSSSAPSKSSTSNQSVQTDVSFTQEEYNNMEQSNRSLREENRLLSESLSSFMSDFDLKLSPLKIPFGTDSYITSSGSSEAPPQNSGNVAKPNDYTINNSLPRVRIPRSKSMQDRRASCRPRLRTRSMNYGLAKRFYDSSSLAIREREPQPYRGNHNSDRFTNVRKANSFSTFDSPSSRQGISVPEYSYSRMPPRQVSVLKNFTIKNSNRALVRRSSMPERTSYQPVMRHKSTRLSSYNRRDAYNGERMDHNFNVVNGNLPISRRSNSIGDYGRPVPFRSLPPEAFY